MTTSREPAAGAKVHLLPQSKRQVLADRWRRLLDASLRRDADTDPEPVVETVDAGRDGRFRFLALNESYDITATHESGCGSSRTEDLAESGQVLLQPWGRIEGEVRATAKGQPLLCRWALKLEPGWALPHPVVAKPRGYSRFVFDRVPPGRVTVVRVEAVIVGFRSFTPTSGSIPIPKNTSTTITLPEIRAMQVRPREIDVIPNQTSRIIIGDTGRPVVGRIAGVGSHMGGVEVVCGILEDAETEEPRYFCTTGSATDGSFHADGISPGTYRLRAWTPEGSVDHKFTVPEIPGGRSDDPLDLGDLKVRIGGRARAADPRKGWTRSLSSTRTR